MKQTIIIIIILCQTAFSFGQKFMVKNGDTVPYQLEIIIQTDTVHYGNKTYYPGDTLFEGACQTFEKINGKIVNQTDAYCLNQGVWTISDSLGNYWSGIYRDNKKIGVWKHYDKNGKLLKEVEEIALDSKVYRIKEIDYSSGKPITVINKPLLSFYIKNLYAFMIIFFVAFFGRIFVNSKIYNNENGTDFSLFYIGFGKLADKKAAHGILCFFTFWFFKYDPKNRWLVITSNSLSLLALIICVAMVIGTTIM